MFKKNEGTLDRAIRVILGLIVISVAYTQQMSWLYVVGALVLLTGAIGFCGVYALFGISTCPIAKK